MIERIFHPVGQGAFYSERHHYEDTTGKPCEFNIVYDCGNWRNTKLADRVVKQSFDKNDVIDILFISHLDFDHISKIPTLIKTVSHIKKVVLPLLHKDQKALLANVFDVLHPDFKGIFTNPVEFFGSDTQVIEVEESNNNFFLESLEQLEDVDLDLISPNQPIPQRAWIGSSLIKGWCYVPFNYKCSARSNQLEDLLVKNGFDVVGLKASPDYFQNNITDAQSRRKLKKVYDSIDGDINQNSMFLYSGPLNSTSNEFYRSWISEGYFSGQYLYKYDRRLVSQNPACIYTGDGDLNVTQIKRIYSALWEHVGTIQVPHHGDIKCFDSKVLDDDHFICPISFGKNNSYGHPSTKVLAQIASQGSYPVQVTEELNSTFIELIERN